MDCSFKTEAEVKNIILTEAKLHDDAPEIITQKRVQGKGTVNRNVTFVLRVKAENEALVNALSALTITYGQSMWLDGTEINLQSGQIEIDYIYVTAVIKPILGA